MRERWMDRQTDRNRERERTVDPSNIVYILVMENIKLGQKTHHYNMHNNDLSVQNYHGLPSCTEKSFPFKAEQREAVSCPFLPFPKTFSSKCTVMKMPHNLWNSRHNV